MEGLCNVSLCNEGLHDCHTNADCNDIEDSFECFCKSGFAGDGVSCEDIDNCAADPCGENMNCLDGAETDFECFCKFGFILDGDDCIDIDECVKNPCTGTSACVNKPGSFDCESKLP